MSIVKLPTARGSVCLAAVAFALAAFGGNLLRNGSFEFGDRYNGMKTLVSQGDFLAFMWSHQKKNWCSLGLEQWWGEGPTNSALFAVRAEARSGVCSLRVSAPGAATTWLVYADDWPTSGVEAVTLSWWVKGAGRGRAALAFHEGAGPLSHERRLAAAEGNVPSAAERWTRGTCTLDIPAKLRNPKKAAFAVRLAAEEGELLFDDVQLEYGRATTEFSEKEDHFLSVSAAGVDEDKLPMFTAGKGGKGGLVVRNTSGKTLSGNLEVYVDAWDGVGKTKVFERRCEDWAGGSAVSVPFDLGSLAPGAYVAVAALGPHVRAEGTYEPKNTGWGIVGRSQLLKRNGMRFAVFADVPPKELFGVGNGMVGNSGWWAGNTMENAVRAKSVRPVLLGEADPFKAAIVGAPHVAEARLYDVGTNSAPDVANPAAPGQLNAFSPSGRAALRERAREAARTFAGDPSVAAAKLANECTTIYHGAFCPDKWADLDFRSWLRLRYADDLARLNAAWGTSFAAWDGVVQPISGMKDGTVEKAGAAAIDWNASFGKMTPAAQQRLLACPAMSMDWYRWRRDATIRLWDDFIREAHRLDRKTLYGNNYCWPNYFPQNIWPQWRGSHDVIMLDLQYVCGFPRTLGTNEEMIDILEQAESVSRGKVPIWGREIYVQPRYPGEMAALQNWAMVAHGMSVPMTFAWRPYADNHKWRSKFSSYGPKSWLLKDAPPMWFIIDVDGSETDCYAPNARSTEEIAAFHRKYNTHTIRRIPGDVAMYFSTEESTHIHFETFDRSYASRAAQCRTAIAAALRYAGARIEYFDDATLHEVTPGQFPVMIAAGERMVSDEAEARLRGYVARGGTLIAFNDFNTLEVNLRPKPHPGVENWTGLVGRVVEVKDFVGKYSTLPYNTREYDERLESFLRENLSNCRHAWWENETPRQDGEEKLPPGAGRPIVEVVVREQKGTRQRFAFVLNKGGAGRGVLRGPDFYGVKMVDALTGEPAEPAFTLPAFGYRVLTFPARVWDSR